MLVLHLLGAAEAARADLTDNLVALVFQAMNLYLTQGQSLRLSTLDISWAK
jgi:hypothetical protein